MSMQSYSKKMPQALLFSQNPSILDGVVERRVERFQPNGSRSGYTAGQTLEFFITTDQLQDLTSGMLCFDLAISGTSSGSARISNAVDVIKNFSIFLNDVQLESIQDTAAWINTFMSFTCNRSYLQTEADVLLGINNQEHISSVASPIRSFSVPLALVSGLCRAQNYFPTLGSKLRFVFELAPNRDVISLPGNVDNAYTLNNVSMTMDTIIVSSEYRQKLQQVIASDQGLRFNFGSLQTSKHQVAGATQQYLRIPYNLSNALSLVVLYAPSNTTKAWDATAWTLQNQSFPLQDKGFQRLEVRSGSRIFTGNDGILTTPELYVSAEKCINSFLNFVGSGYIDFKTFTDGYTRNTTISSGQYGIMPLAVNLEKALQSDDSLINDGISSAQGLQEFDMRLTTNSPLDGGASFLSCIYHRRTLKMSSNGVVLEY